VTFGIRASISAVGVTTMREMAKGTHMKNMESQLQQVTSTMGEFQNRVDQLEQGSERNYEAIGGLEHRLEGSLNQMRDDINQMREEMGNQLQQFMLIFTQQNQVRMAPDFPPRTRIEPILHNERMYQGNGALEIEVE